MLWKSGCRGTAPATAVLLATKNRATAVNYRRKEAKQIAAKRTQLLREQNEEKVVDAESSTKLPRES